MSTIKPFTISVPQPKLDDLRARLERTSWPSTIEGQNYGGPAPQQIKRLAEQAAAFDWRKKEAELNQLPHFTVAPDPGAEGHHGQDARSGHATMSRGSLVSAAGGETRWAKGPSAS